MKVNYYSKNYEVGDEVKGYIEERIAKFSKYAVDAESISANIKIEKTKHQNDLDGFDMSCELEIDGNGYFAEKTAPTTFQAFDECENALSSIIRKGKDKEISDRRKHSGLEDVEVDETY